MSEKKNIREFDLNGLKEYFEALGDKRFRAMQAYEWLWKKNARSFDEMSNLSLELRAKLKEEFTLNAITLDTIQHSNDGTIKSRFKTWDGHLIEGVLIPTEKRFTACVSSQVGCSLTCAFCATGKMDRKRNLGFDEIYDQVAMLNEQCQEKYGKNLSNIVYMGMGEPLLNYKNVLKSIERVTSPEAMNMSPNRITVSTAGVSKMIRQLGDDEVRFNLAVSLHAPTDGQRTEIMPINESNNLKILIESLQYFHLKTKNEITLEYILFNEVNDSIEDAENLVKIYRQVPTHLVNVIEYNPIEGVSFMKPNEERTNAFTDYLIKHKINVRVRRSRGKDIDAACGQLANKG